MINVTCCHYHQAPLCAPACWKNSIWVGWSSSWSLQSLAPQGAEPLSPWLGHSEAAVPDVWGCIPEGWCDRAGSTAGRWPAPSKWLWECADGCSAGFGSSVLVDEERSAPCSSCREVAQLGAEMMQALSLELPEWWCGGVAGTGPADRAGVSERLQSAAEANSHWAPAPGTTFPH